MKQLIKDVLEDMSQDQINLASETARETIATVIISAIRASDKGWYLDLDHSEEREKEDKKMIESHMTEEWKARESWVCDICGENTFDVDWDYIGSGTNHLGCELKLELEEPVRTEDGEYVEVEMKSDKRVSNDRRKGDRREREHSINTYFTADVKDKQEQIKARGVIKPKKKKKKKFYEDAGDGHMLEVGKLAEEIVDKQEGKWVYESPDGGKTVFRRPFSNYDPKYKEEIDFKTKEPTGRMFTDYPFKDVQIDGC